MAWQVMCKKIQNYYKLFCSDEGLTLETSAFLIFHGGNSTFINLFDKTKFLLYTWAG